MPLPAERPLNQSASQPRSPSSHCCWGKGNLPVNWIKRRYADHRKYRSYQAHSTHAATTAQLLPSYRGVDERTGKMPRLPPVSGQAVLHHRHGEAQSIGNAIPSLFTGQPRLGRRRGAGALARWLPTGQRVSSYKPTRRCAFIATRHATKPVHDHQQRGCHAGGRADRAARRRSQTVRLAIGMERGEQPVSCSSRRYPTCCRSLPRHGRRLELLRPVSNPDAKATRAERHLIRIGKES